MIFCQYRKKKRFGKKHVVLKIFGETKLTENIWGENNFRYIKKNSSEILKDILENSFLYGYKENNGGN